MTESGPRGLHVVFPEIPNSAVCVTTPLPAERSRERVREGHVIHGPANAPVKLYLHSDPETIGLASPKIDTGHPGSTITSCFGRLGWQAPIEFLR